MIGSTDPLGARPHSAGVRVALLLITTAVLLTFHETVHNDFVGWDDDHVLLRNDRYRGLDGEHLGWMFTTGFAGHYQPLTWLSYAVETQWLWGLNAAGLHFTNLVLHLATALTFFFIARRLIAAARPSFAPQNLILGALAATLLFALHPLRVESVAWATERRDVLSAAWLMATVFGYLRFVQGPTTGRRRWFAAALACYILSLLSKASGMTLPLVLLLLDLYPLRRIGSQRGSVTRVFVEKLFFAVPAAGAAVLALWAQSHAGALRTLSDHPLSLRVAQACFGTVFYLGKTVWPANLVPLYEQQPEASAFDLANVLSALVVAGVSIVLWRRRARDPASLLSWAAYVVLLIPMLGLAQSGPQLAADRYTYVACMPWALLAGGAVGVVSTTRGRRIAAATLAVVVSLVLAVISQGQVGIWKNSFTLWRTTLERRPDTPTAHVNLAVEYNRRGEFGLGREHATECLRRLPGNRAAHVALAQAAMELGDLETAERHGQIALTIAEHVGRTDTSTMVGLAIVHTLLGRHDEAERLYREVIELEPSVAEWRFDLGGFLASRGRYEEAKTLFEQTLDLDPRRPHAAQRLGIVLMNLGRPAQAVRVWTAALERDATDTELSVQLAWLLATCRDDEVRDGARALTLARLAVQESGGRSTKATEALAAALAETGDIAAAIATLEQNPRSSNDNASPSWRARVEAQLDAYRSGWPYRE